MDLGLNQVIKKASIKTDSSANKLISINNSVGDYQIYGVIICCEGFLIFKDLNTESLEK